MLGKVKDKIHFFSSTEVKVYGNIQMRDRSAVSFYAYFVIVDSNADDIAGDGV